MTQLEPQVFVGRAAPTADAIKPVTNEKFWKPVGGLWTSTLNHEGGEWLRWLLSEIFTRYATVEDLQGSERWGGRMWKLTPREANVAIVHEPADLRMLHERYPQQLTEAEKQIRSFALLIDWEALSRDYDGMHIPNPWPWRFGGDYEASMFFYGMDAECTCWFRWCFEGEPEEIDATPFLERHRKSYEESAA